MKNPSVQEIAQRLLKFYETYGWCQGWYARDAQQDVVGIDHPMATSFCLKGALTKCGIKTYLLDKVLNPKHQSLVDFSPTTRINDQEGQTFDGIQDLLRGLAARKPRAVRKRRALGVESV